MNINHIESIGIISSHGKIINKEEIMINIDEMIGPIDSIQNILITEAEEILMMDGGMIMIKEEIIIMNIIIDAKMKIGDLINKEMINLTDLLKKINNLSNMSKIEFRNLDLLMKIQMIIIK
jgi:hypothetical protein